MSVKEAKGMKRTDFIKWLKAAGWEISGEVAKRPGQRPIRIPGHREVSIGVIRQARSLNAA